MSNKGLPVRKYIKGDKKMVGFRLPTELMEKLSGIAKDSGWSLTDVVQTLLDQYVQEHEEAKRGKK